MWRQRDPAALSAEDIRVFVWRRTQREPVVLPPEHIQGLVRRQGNPLVHERMQWDAVPVPFELFLENAPEHHDNNPWYHY